MTIFIDGGPAFPITNSAYDKDIEDGITEGIVHFGMGMSIRDYFAAHALQGLLSNSSITSEIFNQTNKNYDSWIEKSAWLYADKMIYLQYDGKEI